MIIEIETLEDGPWANPSYWDVQAIPRVGETIHAGDYSGVVIEVSWVIDPGISPIAGLEASIKVSVNESSSS